MRKSRYSEGQITGFIKQADAGMSVAELCRKEGFSSATFYKWRAKFGGMRIRATPSGCWQPEVLEDALDHRRLQDRGDNLQLAAAVRAVLHVDLEHALEQSRPADARRPAAQVIRLVFLRFRSGSTVVIVPCRHHLRAQLGVGCQHAK